MEIWYFLAVFLLFDLVIVLYVLFFRGHGLSHKDRLEYLEHWHRIKNSSDPKHAIMDADKLLDIVLQKKGYTGSLGEKLKQGGKLFSDLDGVWSAHKLRNKIAHELSYHISAGQFATALKQFERALRDLGLFS